MRKITVALYSRQPSATTKPKKHIPSDRNGREIINLFSTRVVDYFSLSTSISGEAGKISWNCGRARSFGGFASLVQQQEAANNAKEETTSAEIMRIMEPVKLDFVKKYKNLVECPDSSGESGKGAHLVGVT